MTFYDIPNCLQQQLLLGTSKFCTGTGAPD